MEVLLLILYKKLSLPRICSPFSSVLCGTCALRLGRGHQGGHRTRRAADYIVAIHRRLPILVRIIPKLAERIPCRLRDRGAFDLAAAAELPGIEAAGSASSPNRRLTL